jgi:broad specificity phosphatase PhoE
MGGMKLLLVRHGQSIANAEGRLQGQFDSPLSDLGRGQARALAERLVREEQAVSALYASDLRRAAETAQILAGYLAAPVTLDARLREYDWGVFSGLTWGEIRSRHPAIWQRWQAGEGRISIPEEEGHEPFTRRVTAAWADMQAGHQDEEVVLVVAHGGSLGTMLALLLGMAPRRPNPFRFGNACLSIVELGPRGARLWLHNDTCHVDRHRAEWVVAE